MIKFSVTYQIVSQESAEQGEAEEQGYISQDIGLREAMADLFETRTSHCAGVECVECDDWPVIAPRLIIVSNGLEFKSGDCESRSLHIPEQVTAASRRRIARLCGVKVP